MQVRRPCVDPVLMSRENTTTLESINQRPKPGIAHITPIYPRKMTLRVTSLCLNILFVLVGSSLFVHGWTLPTNYHHHRHAQSQLQYKNGNSDESQTIHNVLSNDAIVSTNIVVTSKSSDLQSNEKRYSGKDDFVRRIDLPRHSPPKDVVSQAKMLMDFELIVGRAAMILSLLVFAREIFFRIGLPMTIN